MMDIKKGGLVFFIFFLISFAQPVSNRLKLAYEAHKRGLYSISNSQIDKYIKENPNAPDIDYAYLLYGVNFLYLDQPDKAIEKFNILRKEKPETKFLKDTLSYLILAYLKKGDINSSLSIYSEYKQKFAPDSFLENQIAQFILSTAITVFKKGDIKNSRPLFHLISNELSFSNYSGMALYYEALTYYQENDFDTAIKLFKNALILSEQIDPKDIVADIYLKLGDCFLNKKDYTTAEHFFLKVKNEFPDTVYSSWALFQMSLIEKRKGDLEKASSLLEELKTRPVEDLHFKVLSELANVKMLQEKWAESEAYLKEISEIPSDQTDLSEIYLKLGFVNFNMKEWDEAIIYFKKVLELSAGKQTKESAYFWLGYTYYMKNLFNDAFSIWQRLCVEFPESNYIHEILFFTGKKYYEEGIYAEAETYLTDITTRFPDSPFYTPAIEMLVESKIYQGKLNEAITVCEKFLEKNKSETVSFLYGKTLYLLKDFKKAKDVLEKTRFSKPSQEVEATYYLAEIYEKRGEIEKAQEKYLEIVTFFPSFKEWVTLAEEKLNQMKK